MYNINFETIIKEANPNGVGFLIVVCRYYLHSLPTVIPPQQYSIANINSKQVGLIPIQKFFSFPPQQHRNNTISIIQVQLQPPKQPPPWFSPHGSLLNKPLNIVTSLLSCILSRKLLCNSFYSTIWQVQKKCYSWIQYVYILYVLVYNYCRSYPDRSDTTIV